MYYDADFFKENNLQPPKTWAELETLCAKIHEITGGYAIGSDYLDENYVDMVTQLGGEFIDYENKVAPWDSEESLTALKYFKNLEEKGYLIRKENPADGRSRLLFATEKAEQLKNSKAHIEAKFYEWLLMPLSEPERAEFARILDILYYRCKEESKADFPEMSRIIKEGESNE